MATKKRDSYFTIATIEIERTGKRETVQRAINRAAGNADLSASVVRYVNRALSSYGLRAVNFRIETTIEKD